MESKKEEVNWKLRDGERVVGYVMFHLLVFTYR